MQPETITQVGRGCYLAGTLLFALLPIFLKLCGIDELTFYSWIGEPSVYHAGYTWDLVAEMTYPGVILGGAVGSAFYFVVVGIVSPEGRSAP